MCDLVIIKACLNYCRHELHFLKEKYRHTMELNNVGMCSLYCNLTHIYHLSPICKSDM